MPRHSETRYLPHSAQQMYALVADVKRYAEFLPWVIAMRVRSDTPTETVADMIVGFKGLRESFSSRVIKEPVGRISVDYLDGPMRHLHNEWRFTPVETGGCRVDFMVDFAFRSSLFERMAGQMFDRALRKMIAAFETRADVLYGTASLTSSPATSPSAAG
ncbi:MAG: type II toxin-antitoxin system RatA family toxin [Sphingopyxis sp.]|nr:type II toxin-antitoxin system RatA family toxin [Sphingopyxis sp.]